MGEKGKEDPEMKAFLIDTDVLIDHLRGEEKARRFLQQWKTPEASLHYSVFLFFF